MTGLFQTVLDSATKVKNKISPYVEGLLFSTGRKNCNSMAQALSIPVKRLYNSFVNILDQITTYRSLLVELANCMPTINGYRVLVVDATLLSKSFAKAIDHLSVDYDGVVRRVTKGLSIVVAGIVSGGNIIPLDFLFWHNKKNTKHTYKTKTILAMEVIDRLCKIVSLDYVALDGAFCSEKMITFLEGHGLMYTMRIPRSRVVIINGEKGRIDENKAFKLVKNERCKTVKGTYQGHECFFTVHKRKKRGGGWELVFIISNMNLSAKEQVAAYDRRWTIDKSFRTEKQYFGISDCQMLSEEKQTLHILSVFVAYAYATLEKIASQKKSVEQVLNDWRKSKKS